MKLTFMEWDCPSCGRHNREECNSWGYGSPVRICPGCRAEYLDRRWREVAVEGFDPRSTNPKVYFTGAGILAVIALIAGLMVVYTSHAYGHYSLKALATAVGGLLVSVLCLVQAFRIRSGAEERAQQPYMDESIRRLQDAAYVEKLISYGYDVPQKYRK